MANARERIEKLISENPVVLFMKGTPEFPQCGFSGQVIQILDYLGAPVHGVNVLEDAEIRQGVKEFANWPTIPQLYIKGEFVGGCDIAREMFQSGELASVLTDAGRRIEEQGEGLIRAGAAPSGRRRRIDARISMALAAGSSRRSRRWSRPSSCIERLRWALKRAEMRSSGSGGLRGVMATLRHDYPEGTPALLVPRQGALSLYIGFSR